jgi:hypothetical protein
LVMVERAYSFAEQCYSPLLDCLTRAGIMADIIAQVTVRQGLNGMGWGFVAGMDWLAATLTQKR